MKCRNGRRPEFCDYVFKEGVQLIPSVCINCIKYLEHEINSLKTEVFLLKKSNNIILSLASKYMCPNGDIIWRNKEISLREVVGLLLDKFGLKVGIEESIPEKIVLKKKVKK